MKTLAEVVFARACCDEDKDIEELSCNRCPYHNLNRGWLECARQLVKDESIYLKKYLNELQKGKVSGEYYNAWREDQNKIRDLTVNMERLQDKIRALKENAYQVGYNEGVKDGKEYAIDDGWTYQGGS